MGRVKEIHTREERYARKNARRGEMRKEVRKAAFITDYLLLRSPEIHREATEFFDQLERIYPTKLDLRKTVQFKNWQRKRLGIPTQGRGNCLDVATPEDHRITVPEDQNTAMPEDHEPETVPETLLDMLDLKEMHLQIELMPPPKQNPQRVNQETVDEGEQPSVEADAGIPLHEAMNVFDLTDVAAEIDLLPSLFEEIPPHVMDEMVGELRADPLWGSLMDQIDDNLFM